MTSLFVHSNKKKSMIDTCERSTSPSTLQWLFCWMLRIDRDIYNLINFEDVNINNKMLYLWPCDWKLAEKYTTPLKRVIPLFCNSRNFNTRMKSQRRHAIVQNIYRLGYLIDTSKKYTIILLSFVTI